MAWANVPQCERCWIDAHAEYDLAADGHGQQLITLRMPVRLTEPVPEVCHWCGALTIFGVYVRTEVSRDDADQGEAVMNDIDP